MFSPIAKKSLLLLISFTSLASAQSCLSFGVDFQDGGSYFQNSLSTDPFTFVSEFTGCQNDTCFNILVDPQGDQVQCSDTQLTPDDNPQLSTCPTLKDQLVTGAYSVILISNDGTGDPIAYQRDFNLTVEPQQTVTVTPTVTVSVTSTPVVNITSTFIDVVSNVTLPASTVYAPSTTIVNTKTVVPKPVTSTTIKTMFTINEARPIVSIIKSTKIVTPTCTVPPRQTSVDPTCRIKPTVGGAQAAIIQSIATQAVPALATASATSPGATANSAKFKKWRIHERGIELDKREFVRERSERLRAAHLVKRAPDQPVVNATDTNTADWSTVTTTVLAATSTGTLVTTLSTTSTITPTPITVISGKATAPIVTVTAATPTKLITHYTVAYNTIPKTYSITVTITSTTTAGPAATACKSRGGHFGW